MTVHADLPLTSSHWDTYRASVADGRVLELPALEQDSDSSPIGQGILSCRNQAARHRPASRYHT